MREFRVDEAALYLNVTPKMHSSQLLAGSPNVTIKQQPFLTNNNPLMSRKPGHTVLLFL